MFDRITKISEDNGLYKKGLIKAELDIKDNLWFLTVILKRSSYARMSRTGCHVAISWFLGWQGQPR